VIEGRAFAKLTLSLRVAAPVASGLHPVSGRFQSLDWYDALTLDTAEEDRVASSSGAAVIDDTDNLAWRAAVSVRDRAVAQPPLSLVLDKELPVAAGVGGGSADAAAALGMTGALLGVDRADLDDLAPGLGSDVPFCLVGGSGWVGGTGERVDRLPALTGFAIGLVVPPIEVPTPAVYRRWDALGAPSGSPIDPTSIPPPLRDEPIANDLLPAAVAEVAEIGDWRHELERRWGRPVALAGSGPTLFAFFVDRDEAASAIGDIPSGVRAAREAVPVDHGWLLRHPGSGRIVDSRGRSLRADAW
jgi:4-diphosphocytidyl-2-C-methyl-D-erythritol kinase